MNPTCPISPFNNNIIEVDGSMVSRKMDEQLVAPAEEMEEEIEVPEVEGETLDAMRQRRIERAARRQGTDEEWDKSFPVETAAPADRVRARLWSPET